MSAAPGVTELAARGSGWGGAVAGLVAGIVFVLFSAWIVVLRVRSHRKDIDG